MALRKKEQLATGYPAEYWRFSHGYISADAKEAHFTVAAYKDQKTRQATNAPMTTRDYTVRNEIVAQDAVAPADDFDRFFWVDRSLPASAYAYLLERDPFFSDAENV
jgi:hypothetical protein